MLKLICLLACIFPALQLEDLSQTAKNYAEQLVAARRKGITELEDEITKLRKGKASKQQIAKAKEKLESLEAKIAETETQLATIEGRLSAPASPDSAIADAKLYEQTGNALEELMTEWELMAGQIDALE